MSDLVCEHGSLRRKCEICERDERIKELEEALREIVALKWGAFGSSEPARIAERALRGEDRPLDASGLDGEENSPLDDK